MTTTGNAWPARPLVWPEVMNEVEVCLYLRLDDCRTINGARRSLRHIRRTQGLRSAGRIGGRVVFRRETVDAWLSSREAVQVPNQSRVTK